MTRTTSKPMPRSTSTTTTAGFSALDERVWRELDRAIDDRTEQLVKFRRRIHASPEGSGEEHATTALVAQMLKDAGIEPRIMPDGVGLAADIELGAASHFVGIRAELDCVKVDDDKKVSYASTRPGLCHACGHDAHTTVALATTMVIHEHREQLKCIGFKHNIRAVFQSAEETANGAKRMIEQGGLKNVAAILAVHVEPFLDAGVIGLRKGPLTSCCKSFRIAIHGRSGHSARPYQALDPIPAATNLIDQFYQLGPRSMDSRYPLALTVASINAGSSFNAIPDDAEIKGTLRTARVEDLAAVQKKMEAIIRGVAESTGCEITMDFPQYAPATNNDGALIDVMAGAATQLLGEKNVHWLEVPSLGAEDFAFYQEVIPGAIVRLGAGVKDSKNRRPLHSSLFDIDEAALTIGAKFMTRSALMAAKNFVGG